MLRADAVADRHGDTEQGRGHRALTWANRARRLWTALTGNSTGGAVVIATATAAAILPPAVRLAVLSMDQPSRAAPRQTLGNDAMLYLVSGRDAKGRTAHFDVIVLRKDIAWVKGSTEQITRNGQVLDGVQFKRVVFLNEVGQRLTAARQLIAVGVASQEGEQSSEESRASERARKIGLWLSEASGIGRGIWTLSLGQYREPCLECETSETSWQRPIVVIGLRRSEAGLVLGEALADALQGLSNLPSPSRYTKFDLQKFL